MNYTVKHKKYQGNIHISPSKSDTQRAMLIASLGEGTSILRNVGKSKDESAMLENIQRLGADCYWIDEKTLSVTGNFKETSFSELNCGESGLGLRLLTAVSSLKSNEIVLSGSGSLKERDQSFFEQFFPKMGVKVHANEGKLPLSVTGPFTAGIYSVDGSESSQYISGLLIAFSQTDGTTQLTVENCASKPYIEMTLHTLRSFGVKIDEVGKDSFQINGIQQINATDYTIDGDWSSASYWLVASALGLTIPVSGLSMSSRQADKAILNAFMTANCRVMNMEDGLHIDGDNRKPLNFDATDCPDLFPALATYASLTPGISKIKGVHRLANKESNRAEALKQEFGKLGIQIQIENDMMFIEGKSALQPATVSSHNDHRIAMCLAIVSIVSGVEITIEQAQSVEKSYPEFWNDLESLMH